MPKKVYECLFIFNANAYARNPASASNSIRQMVESAGGDLLASRLYLEQKLAYPINGHRKGVYWLAFVKMDGDSFSKLNRACQLNDLIIRHMFTSFDPRLVDTLVERAKGAPQPMNQAEAEQTSETDGSDGDSDSETQQQPVALS